MRYIDITAPLGPGTPVYPGDPPVELTRLSEADGGDGFALSRLALGTHAGTHVDPPAHFIPGGATVDQLPLDAMIGPAHVVDLAHGRPVEAADITRLPPAERILLRTGGMPLTEGAAAAIVERGVRLVGVDGLSVAPEDAPGPVHRILLAAGVIIVEGMELAGVPEGAYTLICLPLRLTDGDGAPARAILLNADALMHATRRAEGSVSLRPPEHER
jgi:arylformamidase